MRGISPACEEEEASMLTETNTFRAQIQLRKLLSASERPSLHLLVRKDKFFADFPFQNGAKDEENGDADDDEAAEAYFAQ